MHVLLVELQGLISSHPIMLSVGYVEDCQKCRLSGRPPTQSY